jgi:hypothetical protein
MMTVNYWSLLLTRDNLLTILIHIVIPVFAVYRIHIGRKILRAKTYTITKKVDPLVFLSKAEEITFTGKAARFMGYSWLVVGLGVLALLLINLVFSLVDEQILFLIVMMVTVVSDIIASQKGYSMYLEENL